MLNRLIQALRSRLGIDELERRNHVLEGENERLKKRVKKLEKDPILPDVARRLEHLEYQWHSLSTQAMEALNKAHKLNKTGENIMQHFAIAVDFGGKEPSWAVFCIRGTKQDRVQFIDLRNANWREIEAMLTRFQGIQQSFDGPYGTVKPTKRIEEFL